MNAPRPDAASPFQPAAATDRRLKLLLWGDSGSGKTTHALQYPAPVVIDLEGGTEHYADDFNFHVFKATTADEVTRAVRWLSVHPHAFRTLVIDPITIYWEALQAKWQAIFLRRNKGSKGHHGDFYVLQPKDWSCLKAEFKDLLRQLIQLDMNVIVTARQKVQYSDAGFMRPVGETFDGEKSLPYLFDSILRLYRDENGRFLAENLKDRSNKLPRGHFEISYELIEQRLGRDALVREAVPVRRVTPEQLDRLRFFIATSGMNDETLRRRLAAYDAERLEDLTEDNAQVILDKLTTKAGDTTSTADAPEED